MSTPFDYVRDGTAIYERSFAIIREEAELGRFTPEEAEVAVRMIHACGLVEAAFAIDFAPELVRAARRALNDGKVALGIGLTFGQSDAGALERLAEIAEGLGVAHVEPVAGRALLLVGLASESVSELRVEALSLGFITDPDDPRRLVSACPGAPSCGSGRMETRALAAEIATLANGQTVHVSGCAKGCAHPGPAALTIVGLDEGVGIVVQGTPRDTPAQLVSIAGLRAALRNMFEKNGA